MQIAFEHYGTTCGVSIPEEDISLPQVIELLVRPTLKAAGFLDATIDRVIGAVDEQALDDYYAYVTGNATSPLERAAQEILDNINCGNKDCPNCSGCDCR